MTVTILRGDVREQLKTLADESVQCVVTSPPYFGLRDYGVEGQIGLEPTPEAFVEVMVAVFREVRRVLRADGTLWLNLGDSYAGSGRGGNTGNDSSTLEGAREHQEATRVARGSQLAAGLHESVRQSGGVGRAWVPPPAGLKQKDLIGIPWRVAFALQDDGWYLRQDIIWSKPNPMPESVTDRCTKAHEYLFLLSKSGRYRFDAEGIAEGAVADHPPGNRSHKGKAAYDAGDGKHRTKQGLVAYSQRQRGVPPRHAGLASSDQSGLDEVGRGGKRNKRSVWTVATQPFKEAHFATFPPALIEPCILAGCPKGGLVLDPFGGAGTTGLVADRLGRDAVLIELNPEYAAIAEKRIKGDAPLFATVAA